jgi:hypothetical protein
MELHRAQPAVDAGRNPEPRAEELRPFAPEEIDALAAELGPAYRPLAIFAAETGLRTNLAHVSEEAIGALLDARSRRSGVDVASDDER